MLERAVGPLAAALNGLKPVLRYAILAAIAFSLPAPASAQTGGPRGERLIPATFTQKKDALGFMWNLQHNGVLGRTTRMMIGNGMVLNVNGNQFYSNQIMSTPDGKEYVLHSSNNFGGVTVTRRILLHEKEGVLRYLDIFENRGTMPLSVSVGLNTNCNNRYKDVSTDQGNVGGGSFGKKETGILIRPSDKNHDSILFCAVSPRAKVRPVINTQNKYSVTFSYQLAVPANGMVCLLHSVAQRKTPAKLDAKSLGKLFKPLQLSRLLKGIRAEF